MENIHAGHRNRLRDKAFRFGIDALQDHEILELMLSYVVPYKDMNPVAHACIRKFGNIHNVLVAPIEDLMTVPGIGEKTAKYIISLGQFSQYYHLFGAKEEKVRLGNPIAAFHYCSKLVSRLEHEEFYLICMTNDSYIKSVEKFSRGTSNETNFNMKDVVGYILKNNSTNVMMCHNHPHGKKEPSGNDNLVTKTLFMALAFHGIQLVDHVIVGGNCDCFSYAQSGMFRDWEKECKQIIGESRMIELRSNSVKYGED